MQPSRPPPHPSQRLTPPDDCRHSRRGSPSLVSCSFFQRRNASTTLLSISSLFRTQSGSESAVALPILPPRLAAAPVSKKNTAVSGFQQRLAQLRCSAASLPAPPLCAEACLRPAIAASVNLTPSLTRPHCSLCRRPSLATAYPRVPPRVSLTVQSIEKRFGILTAIWIWVEVLQQESLNKAKHACRMMALMGLSQNLW